LPAAGAPPRLREQMFDNSVLGVDPGVANLGLAVVAHRDRKATLVWANTVRTSPDLSEAERLRKVVENIEQRLEKLATT